MLLKKTQIIKVIGLSLIAGIFTSCNKDDNGGSPIINDLAGEIEYIKTFGGSDEDDAASIVENADGSYTIFGSTRSIDGDITDKTSNDLDYWLLKVSETGEKIWSKTYGGSDDEKGAKITKTSDGGYLLSGYSSSSDGDVSGNEGFHDYWLLKVNSEGAVQWDRNYGFSGSDQAFDAFQTKDGGYFLTGFLDVTASGGLGNDDGKSRTLHGVGEYWAIKLDSGGNREWRRFFGGTNNDRSYDALETADGGFLMVGASESIDFDITDSKGSYDFWAVRLNGNGDKLWTKSFGGTEIDIGYAVTITKDGNYMLVGDTRSADGDITSALGNADAWVVKFDDSGNIIWQRTYGGDQFESARSVKPLANGNYLISGSTRSGNGDLTANYGENDAWVYIIDGQGNLEFQVNSGGSSLDFANDAIETNDNKVVVVGNTESDDVDITQNKGIKDFLIIKIK